MSRKQQFYDPFVSDGAEPGIQIRGFEVQIGGTYVLMSDVVNAIRAYAQSLDEPDAGALIHELANWLTAGGALSVPEATQWKEDVVPGTITADNHPVHGAEPDDVTPDVERVEVFPDAEGKWYARSIDTSGNIMKVTGGSYDKPWVIKNAEERWPGIPLREVQDAMGDSMWAERGHKSPSPKRLWAGVNA